MAWTNNLLGVAGNYAAITQTLTPDDGKCLEAIYNVYSTANFKNPETGQPYSTIEAIQADIRLNMSKQIADVNNDINTSSIATLKAVGCIVTDDNIHVGLTLLGLRFMEAMLNA